MHLNILNPDFYAVVGNPIAQSKSPIIYAAFAKALGHAIVYDRIEAPLGAFATTVDEIRKRGGRGINVTAPFKVDAFAYATHASEAATTAGAANALKFDDENVYAENFDGIGLLRDIEVNLGVSLTAKRILLLGAGGATRGALTPLLRAMPRSLVIANRDVAKAKTLVMEVAANTVARAVGYDALDAESFDVVLNATSSSLSQSLPPISAALFSHCELAYDLTYGKGLTPFLKLASQNANTQIADGVGMLVEQAAQAFAWWRGARPETQRVIEALRVPLI
jgi:shikimate dehydrogenase